MVQVSRFLRMGVWVSGVLTGLLVQAQTAPVSPPRAPVSTAPQASGDPVVDPAAPVPAVQYRSVFSPASGGVETREVDWRRANDDVGQFRRGHVDILKWESDHEGKH